MNFTTVKDSKTSIDQCLSLEKMKHCFSEY